MVFSFYNPPSLPETYYALYILDAIGEKIEDNGLAEHLRGKESARYPTPSSA
ncbi:hypothetical protein [Archaeoglobus sulfaticallidus]|uniref:hypothetical protein n=1 Tax=Archaeoglobus sulfaticallidus TaxID=1316941 RepID=UPI000B152D2A|nr:hypothetical protein [Archaeoglobus sulfaticallidus]